MSHANIAIILKTNFDCKNSNDSDVNLESYD
eukprot:UN11924